MSVPHDALLAYYNAQGTGNRLACSIPELVAVIIRFAPSREGLIIARRCLRFHSRAILGGLGGTKPRLARALLVLLTAIAQQSS